MVTQRLEREIFNEYKGDYGTTLKTCRTINRPEDSAIYVNGTNIEKILFCKDADVSELLLAKPLRHDAVVAHHPVGEIVTINFRQVFKRHIQQMVETGIPRNKKEKAVGNLVN